MIRNWGWYELVTLESGLSQRKIDKDLLGEDTAGDKPLFGQMKKHCRSPDKQRRPTDKTVFESVHAGGAFKNAQRWFESDLWTILASKDLRPSDYDAFVQRRVDTFNEEHGSKANKKEFLDSLAVIDGLHLAMETQPQPTEPVHSPAWNGYFFEEMRPIEELEMYSALYRLKISSPSETRSIIRTWIRNAANNLVRAKPFNEEKHLKVSECLKLLIADRILQNQWWTKEDYINHCEKKDKNIRFGDYVAWYKAVSVPFGAPALLAKQHL